MSLWAVKAIRGPVEGQSGVCRAGCTVNVNTTMVANSDSSLVLILGHWFMFRSFPH